MTQSEFTELWMLSLRGTVATAFSHSQAQISDEHWAMLRGEVEFTMRDIGEIGHITGFNMNLQLSAIRENPND